MKKNLIVLLTFLMFVFGCVPNREKDFENDELVPDFSLEEGQESHDVNSEWVVILDSNGDTGDTGSTGGTDLNGVDWSEIALEDIENEVEAIREEMLEEDEEIEEELEETAEKDESDVIWEGYLLGTADGNPTAEHDVYLSDLSAYFYGNIYVYGDYSVGGSVTVTYRNAGGCRVESELLTCSLIGTNDGVYNIVGNVVQYLDDGQSNSGWPFPDDYWLQVFFVRGVAVSEDILVVGQDYFDDVTDSGLEAILYGPFQYPHLLKPGSDSDTQLFEVKNRWATGEVSIQLYDDKEMYELFRDVYGEGGNL